MAQNQIDFWDRFNPKEDDNILRRALGLSANAKREGSIYYGGRRPHSGDGIKNFMQGFTKPVLTSPGSKQSVLDPRNDDNVLRRAFGLSDQSKKDGSRFYWLRAGTPPVANERAPLSAPVKRGPNTSRNMVTARDQGNNVAQPQEQGAPDFAEYLARFSSSGSADTSAIDAQEADLRRRGAEGQTAIGGIYSSLAAQLAKQQAGIDANFASAGAQSQATADQTAAAISGGTNAATAQQAALLRALGMQDQAGSVANQEAQADQADAAQDAALANQAQQGQFTAGALTQKNLNTSNQTAAGFRGAEEQAALASQLTTMLAELGGQRSQLQSQAQSQNFDLAKLAYDNDYQRYNDDRRYGAQREDEMWDRSLDQRKFDASIAPKAPPQDKTTTGLIESRLRAAGATPKAQQSIMDLLLSGEAIDPAGRSKITPKLLQSYGLDPKKYTPAYVGTLAAEFWNEFQK